MKKGKFIAFYGMNNLGKTTLTKSLADYLISQGINSIYLKYPIYDLEPTGPRINRYLREGNPERLNAGNAQEIYAQNRRDYEPVLKCEYLDKGIWVVAEDYKGTGLCWGLIGGADYNWLKAINSDLLEPELSVLMDGVRFNTGIEANHLHESRDDWDRGRQIHQEVATEFDWKRINANQPPEVVLNEAIAILTQRFPTEIEGRIKTNKEIAV